MNSDELVCVQLEGIAPFSHESKAALIAKSSWGGRLARQKIGGSCCGKSRAQRGLRLWPKEALLVDITADMSNDGNITGWGTKGPGGFALFPLVYFLHGHKGAVGLAVEYCRNWSLLCPFADPDPEQEFGFHQVHKAARSICKNEFTEQDVHLELRRKLGREQHLQDRMASEVNETIRSPNLDVATELREVTPLLANEFGRFSV